MRQPLTGKDAQNARPARLRRLTPQRRPCDRRLDRWHRSRSHRPRPHHPHPRPRPRAPPRPLGRPGRQARPAGASVRHPLPRHATQAGCSRRPSCHGQAIRPHRGKRPCPLSTRCPDFRFRSGGLRQRTRVTAGDNPGRKPGPLHPLEFAPSGTIRGRPRIASWRWTPLEHTPHRATGIRPGGGGPALTPSAESRPSRTQGSSPAVPGGQEGAPGTASFQPLKRSDYMSSAGIRPPVQRTTPASSPPSAPARRPGDDALTEGCVASHPVFLVVPCLRWRRPSACAPTRQRPAACESCRRGQDSASREADDPGGSAQPDAVRATGQPASPRKPSEWFTGRSAAARASPRRLPA